MLILTKNFYRAVALKTAGLASSSIMISPNGVAQSVTAIPSMTVSEMMSKVLTTYYDEIYGGTGTQYNGILFCNGTTTPTIDDVKPEGSIFNTVTEAHSVSTKSNDDGSVTTTAIYTLTNTGTADFTISEICLMAYLYNYVGTFTSYGHALMARGVLDNPVTIAAGGIGVVNCAVTAKIPTA